MHDTRYIGNHNYCRNPSPGEKTKPWCYTVGGTTRWEYCNVGKPKLTCPAAPAKPPCGPVQCTDTGRFKSKQVYTTRDSTRGKRPTAIGAFAFVAVRGIEGSDSCPKGSQPINNAADCWLAVAALAGTTANKNTQAFTDRPQKCNMVKGIRGGLPTASYNTNEQRTTNDGQHTPVCQQPVEYGHITGSGATGVACGGVTFKNKGGMNVAECKETCSQNSDCSAFEHRASDGKCFFKSGVTVEGMDMRFSDGAHSCYRKKTLGITENAYCVDSNGNTMKDTASPPFEYDAFHLFKSHSQCMLPNHPHTGQDNLYMWQ